MLNRFTQPQSPRFNLSNRGPCVDDAGAAVAGQALPSELAPEFGFTPLAFANALRIGSSSPVYVAVKPFRRGFPSAPWPIVDTTDRAA